MEFCAPLCHLTWGGNGLPGVEFTDKIKVKCKIPQIFHWPGDGWVIVTVS